MAAANEGKPNGMTAQTHNAIKCDICGAEVDLAREHIYCDGAPDCPPEAQQQHLMDSELDNVCNRQQP